MLSLSKLKELTIKEGLCIACRVLLGVLFILSASLKLASIDAFELYIYGFELFDYALSCYAARLVLLTEYFIGIVYLLSIRNKWVDYLCGLMLCGFTLFLVVLIFNGVDGNCHCFGESVEFSPKESILKNVFLIVLFVFAIQSRNFIFSFNKRIFIVSLLIASVLSFFILPPYPFGTLRETPFNSDKFAIFMEQDSLSDGLSEGDDLVFFLSTKCKYCKLAAKRLDILLKSYPYPSDKIHLYVWGKEEDIPAFFEENQVAPLPYQIIHPITLLDITSGKMPLILLLRDGVVVGKMNNSTYNEELLINFINNKK